MSGCCDPRGPQFARHVASRYRKRGLDKTAGRMVGYLADRGVDGASVLEIGGDVGALQLGARAVPPNLNSSTPTIPTRATAPSQPECASG
jgi:hypothetical protein